MSKNIILCGVGGQGTILASRLIASAAMKKGLRVLLDTDLSSRPIPGRFPLQRVLLRKRR